MKDDNGRYTIRFSLSDRVKNVRFFFGTLNENGVIPSYAPDIPKNDEGITEIVFNKGSIDETFAVMASATTILGNPYVTEQIHHITIRD